MQKFDVFDIGGELFLVVQADHLLELNTLILLPILPRENMPALRKLTVDIEIEGAPHRVRAHMPVTAEARRFRNLKPVHRLSQEEGQRVMDGLYTILWGF